MMLPLVVYLTPGDIRALKICQAFFKANDALPSARTLAAKLNRSKSSADHHLASLSRFGLLEKNEQGGLKFTRRRYVVLQKPDRRKAEAG